MGRPKKGELVYRKNLRKNGYKQVIKSVEKTPSHNSSHSSYGEDFGHDDSPIEQDVFDPLSSSQRHDIQNAHQQISDHTHPHHHHHLHHSQQQQQQQHQQQQDHLQHPHPHSQQQQQQQQQPQQQQQASGFSLGTLLHDCMTVEDWDGTPVMESQDQVPHGLSSSGSMVISQSSDNVTVSRGFESEIPQPLSHHQRQTSPTPLSSDSQINIQQAHQHHQPRQSRHLQMIQHPHTKQQSPTHHLDLSHIQQDHFQPSHHPHQRSQQQHHHQSELQHQSDLHASQQPMVQYQYLRDPDNKHDSQGSNSSEVIGGFDYLENEDMGHNRIVKVENLRVAGPSEDHFNSDVNVGNVNFQTLTKVNFQQYPPQGLESNTSYVDEEHHRSSPIFTSGGEMMVPVSQLEPSVSSQIIIYAPGNQVGHPSPHGVDRTGIALRNQSPGHDSNIAVANSQHQQMIKEASHNISHSHKFVNLTPVHSEVVNLSQPQSVVSLQNDPVTSVSDENLVACVSQGNIRPVLNGTNVFLLRQQILNEQMQTEKQMGGSDSSLCVRPSVSYPSSNVSPVASTLKNSNSNKANNINNIDSSISVSSPHLQQQNNNIISQAMAMASDESSGMENSLYLGTERKTPSVASFQQPERGSASQLRDFEELLLTKLNSKLSKEHRYSHSVDDLRIKKSYQDSNHYPKVTQDRDKLHSGSGLGFPSTTGHQDLPSLGTNYPTQSQYQTMRLPNFLEPASRDDKFINKNINNNSMRSNSNNSINEIIVIGNGDVHNLKVGPNHELDSYQDNAALDSAELHETNRIFMDIDNSCGANGCFRRDLRWQSPFDEPSMMEKLSAVDFLPEISHHYWHSFQPKSCRLTAESQKTITDICNAFSNLHSTYMSSETDCPKPMGSNSLDFWHYIQQTIARHVVAGQQFCKNIPDYLKLDIQDRISLGKHVGFGLMVLIACTEFYDPNTKELKKVWACKMPVHGALFTYREHLLSLGERMHGLGVDRTEAALLCAISMTSIDCPELVKPATVSEVQNVLIDALEAHISVKIHSNGRMQILLSLMPQVRLMTVWYNNLMKKMSLPCDMINNKLCKKNCLETTRRLVNMS